MENLTILSDLASDTLEGLSSYPKYLLSKYFYDDAGSSIFQDIMKMPEYYLTGCELEIFNTHKEKIIEHFIRGNPVFDLIEPGSGDGFKTKVLLNSLIKHGSPFNYIPIDISTRANKELEESLSVEFPSLDVKVQTGDFLSVLKRMSDYSATRKIILFLGSNIGNFKEEELKEFVSHLSEIAHHDDRVMIGFDLIKDPNIILRAYDDPLGNTRRFNLNYLARLNRELGADFNLNNFQHHTEYNPQCGEVKSFLISTKAQSVYIEAFEKTFHFDRWETIFMELSRKFRLETITDYAENYGFSVIEHFLDKKGWFVDSLWVKR
ncbi:MAG TPA: L-histidine N(alpha)-methyltransferase [Bacteroidales bacterium]|nr:L-histidine N(alpha)-methyltransferase [Bacteroidales bacterium]